MRRMTTMGSSVLGDENGCRPVSSTYNSTPNPHLQMSARFYLQEHLMRRLMLSLLGDVEAGSVSR